MTMSLSRAAQRRLLLWALLLPMAVVNFVTFILPMLRLGMISFIEARPGGVLTDVFTFGNYIDFFRDPFSYKLIWNSLRMSLIVTLGTLVAAYPIALFLYRVNPVWRNILFVITISPLLVSAVVRTYGWMVLLGNKGLINGLLMSAGLIDGPIRLMNNELGVYIGLIEIMIPYMALALIAGFGRLDPVYEEAAAMLGANAFTRFYRIIVPLTMPGILLGCLLVFVLSVSSFITPKLLGGGRVFLLATEVYDQAIVRLEWTQAASTSVIVLLIFGLAMMLYTRIARRYE
ncbi:ABC transporter permease [Chelativorans composti]|jgi:ABC-type spermidine/putrescine transport system, permease component I|uniref:ABC transporter permease n=1 Tax=Chelativorans composti TaxID=768533 RepID=A0ABW5DIK9_9HYPH